MPIPVLTLFYAILLILIGIGGKYISGTESFTALLPAIFGGIFFVLGIISFFGENLKKHTMHGAAALAVLTLLGTAAGMIARLSRGAEISAIAATSQVLVIVLSTIYLALSVKYFIDRRKEKKAAESENKS